MDVLNQRELFRSGEKDDNSPSEENDQEDYKLSYQLGVHKSSFFSQGLEMIVFFLKIVY
jgi:hypothetical protein